MYFSISNDVFKLNNKIEYEYTEWSVYPTINIYSIKLYSINLNNRMNKYLFSRM